MSNTGHGHVFPRNDGVKARCGGPALCRACAFDRARQEAMAQSPPPDRSEWIVEFMGKNVDDMTREQAIEGLKLALQLWQDARTQMTESHAFYRDLISRPDRTVA